MRLVSRKAIVVAGLSAIAMAASGCSGGSDAEAEGPVDITKLRAELKERFGTPPNEAPWYRHITAINWSTGQTLEVTTDLDESESRRIPCGLLWKFAFEQADKPNTLGVVVVGSDGVEFGGCA
jgi:hypothetical protein